MTPTIAQIDAAIYEEEKWLPVLNGPALIHAKTCAFALRALRLMVDWETVNAVASDIPDTFYFTGRQSAEVKNKAVDHFVKSVFEKLLEKAGG